VGAGADLRQGRALLERLEDFAPWYEAETWVVLARASVRLGDGLGATLMLDEASRALKLTPDAIVLGEWIAETAASIELVSASMIRDLTPAELHILQYLPTHFSFPEIADQVFVSPNTVKTQAQSIYRKLGVTSRREAVEQARAVGLLASGGYESDTTGR
jgi:LuxR family maltose regulon positive regulatory protein